LGCTDGLELVFTVICNLYLASLRWVWRRLVLDRLAISNVGIASPLDFPSEGHSYEVGLAYLVVKASTPLLEE